MTFCDLATPQQITTPNRVESFVAQYEISVDLLVAKAALSQRNVRNAHYVTAIMEVVTLHKERAALNNAQGTKHAIG